MAKDRRLKPCRYCRRNFGIEEMTRSDAECWFHHYYRLCPEHGCFNCCEKAIRAARIEIAPQPC